MECPHAWYVAPSTLAGEHVSTNTWLSTARALCRSSQCTGPVTVLNAPGNTNVSAPRFAHAAASSGEAEVETHPTPNRPADVSTTVNASPAVRTSDSLNVISPGMSTSNRCVLRCFASNAPVSEKTQQVLYSAPVRAHRSNGPRDDDARVRARRVG